MLLKLDTLLSQLHGVIYFLEKNVALTSVQHFLLTMEDDAENIHKQPKRFESKWK